MKKVLSICIILLLTLCVGVVGVSGSASESPGAQKASSANVSPSPSPSEQSLAAHPIKINSSGEQVIRAQYRLLDLGFFCYRPTGQFGQMSRDATINFQIANNLMSDGSIGPESYQKLFENGVARAGMATGFSPKSGPSLKGTPEKSGEIVDWSEVDVNMPVGATVTITDYNTGTSFKMKRTGGVGHAQMEPVSAEDTAGFIASFGEYNYEKRSALVELDSQTVAASLFGWPHGEDTVANNDMEGGVCLYFSGSRSDVLGLPDPEHDAMVKRAASSSGAYVEPVFNN